MTSTNITYSEARTLTLVKCESLVEEMPAGGYTTTEVHDLAENLNWMTSSQGHFRPAYLEDIIDTLIEFADLESGDHIGLIQTANGVYDDGGHVRDYLERQLRDHLYFTVTDAGFKAHSADLDRKVAA